MRLPNRMVWFSSEQKGIDRACGAERATRIGGEMSGSIPAGVVTGKNYQALVQAAKDGGYALPAVNIVGTDSVNAVLEAAAKAKSDVIIQLSNGGAQFFAGKGYPRRL